MLKRSVLLRLVAGCALAPAIVLAQTGGPAQNYPNRQIRVIVPYAPGGISDLLARTIGQKLNEAWGQPVVIENRPGAGTNLAAALAAKSPPDGYVLYAAGITNAVNPTLYGKLDYDPVNDFAMITNIAKVPLMIAVHPSLPARNARELIALAKVRPGQITYASAGNGTSGHLTGELFKSVAGISLMHVPYKGAAPALNEVIGGHVESYFGAVISVVPHVKSGRLRAIGMTSLKRTSAAPELPTLDEQGIKGFDATTWYGMAAPARTPEAIVNKLQGEIARIIKLPEVRDRFAQEGAEFVGNSPAEFTAFVKAEVVKWGKVVLLSGAKVD